MNTVKQYAVQAEGKPAFKVYHVSMSEALEEAKRIARKELVPVRVVQVVAVIKPAITMNIISTEG